MTAESLLLAKSTGKLPGYPARLFRNYILCSLLAIATILLLMGLVGRTLVLDQIRGEAEHEAIALGATISDHQADILRHQTTTGLETLRIHDADRAVLDQWMRQVLSHFDIIKIKVFADSTEIIYSTDREIIGEFDVANASLRSALGGTTVSEFKQRDAALDLASEQRFDLDVVETYVPIHGSNGQIIGCVELYKDVTWHVKSGAATAFKALFWICLSLLLVFGGLIGLMRRATILISQRTQALEAAREEALAATDAKSAFLANVSHEIRTPMTAILGFLDLVNEDLAELGLAESPKITPQIQVITRNANHLLNIMNDILDLSKIEAEGMTVEQMPINLPELLADVVAAVKLQATQKGLALTVHSAKTVPNVILSDPTRLRQILGNLLNNAIKFTAHGQVSLFVNWSGTAQSGQVEFEITDSGIGLSAADQDKIFEPFSQADGSTTRLYGGTGLGLAISRRFARLLGGDLILKQSVVGRGSTFCLTISTGPLPEVTTSSEPPAIPADPLPSAPASTATEIATPLAGCRILLAEDEPDNQRLITHILKKAGAEVEIAENGKIALQKVLEHDSSPRTSVEPHRYDFVLMDMQMPIMDGYVATRTLRELGYSNPIIALTAHAMSAAREQCLRAGCDEFVTKPLDRVRFINTIIRVKEQDQAAACNQPLSITEAPAGWPDYNCSEMRREDDGAVGLIG